MASLLTGTKLQRVCLMNRSWHARKKALQARGLPWEKRLSRMAPYITLEKYARGRELAFFVILGYGEVENSNNFTYGAEIYTNCDQRRFSRIKTSG
jgi:hypothetical protein